MAYVSQGTTTYIFRNWEIPYSGGQLHELVVTSTLEAKNSNTGLVIIRVKYGKEGEHQSIDSGLFQFKIDDNGEALDTLTGIKLTDYEGFGSIAPFNVPYNFVGNAIVTEIKWGGIIASLNCESFKASVNLDRNCICCPQVNIYPENPKISTDLELTSDIPIFTFDTENETCSEFIDKCSPYFLKGDYSNADNAKELNSQGIDFYVNLDNDSKTMYINWNIESDSEITIEGIAIDFYNENHILYPAPFYRESTTDIYYPIVFSYDFILDKLGDTGLELSRKSVDIYLSGKNQDVDYIVGFTFKYPILGLIGYEYDVFTPVSSNLKNTLKVEFGKPEQDSDYTSQNDESVETDTENNTYNGVAELTTTYKVDENFLKSFGNFIWSNSLFDTILNINNSPIENIVSVKGIPINADVLNESEPVKLGNVDSSLKAPTTKNIHTFELSEIKIPHRKDGINFLDYDGFTSISIYLPYIGIKQLSSNVVMGKKIKVKYVVDLVNGTCSAMIKCLIRENWQLIEQFDGMMGVEIPITSSNRAQVESAVIGGIASGIGSLAGFDPLGAVSDIAGGMVTPFHSNTKGVVNGLLSTALPNTAFIMIVRPMVELPKTFAHNKGRMCGLSKKLSGLKGFTILDNPIMTGLSCLEDEKEELRNILTTGFFA